MAASSRKTRKTGKSSVLVAEALAFRDSLVYAKDKGYSRLEVEGDSKLVIDALNGVFVLVGDLPNWWKISDRSRLIFRLSLLNMCLIREANFVIDALAHLSHSLPNGNIWANKVHNEASHALVFDIVNSGCPGAPIFNFMYFP
ncbi:hypothetical protein ACLB2K_055147 [Fragaria x ananassa]